MEFELKDVLYIIVIVGYVLTVFFQTKHRFREYIRDKNDELKEQTGDIKLKVVSYLSAQRHRYYFDVSTNTIRRPLPPQVCNSLIFIYLMLNETINPFKF